MVSRIFKASRKRFIIVSVISFLFAASCILGYQIETLGHIFFSFKSILFFGVIFILFGIFLLFLYGLFDNRTLKEELSGSTEKKVSKYRFLLFFAISFVVLMIFYGIWFLALYPGLFIFDAEWQLSMFREGTISEHHPVLHTVLLGNLIERFKSDEWHINRGIAAYTILQILITAGCFSYFLAFVFKSTRKVLIYILSLLFLGAFPTIVLQVISVTKDSLFMAFLILTVTLSIEMVNDTGAFFKTPGKPFLWGLSLVLSTIFRNNCVYAVPFLLVMIFVLIKEKRKIFLIVTIGSIAVFVLYKVLFVPAFATEEVDGREMFPIPAQQLARVYNSENGNLNSDEIEVIEKLIRKDALEGYVPEIADTVKQGLNMDYFHENKQEVISVYLSVMRKNPVLAIEAFLAESHGFWYVESELTMYWNGGKAYWVVGEYPPAVMHSKIPFLYEFLYRLNNSDYIMRNPVTSLFFAPGVYFWIFAVFFGYALEKRKKGFIAAFVFVFALWLTYHLGPVALVRYTTYLYAMIPIYPALVLADQRTEAE